MTPTILALVLSHLTGWITVRHGIVVLSILAAAVNITGILPQLMTMLRGRSAAGQSPLGWTLAATCSGLLIFVNAIGYHAPVLAAGNLLSFSGCLAAALLARHFGHRSSPALAPVQVLQESPEEVVGALPEPALHALTETVLEEHHRRTGATIPENVVAEMATGEFQALADVVADEYHRRTAHAAPALAHA